MKFIWVVRALCYKPFFKRVGFLTYIGKPIFLRKTKQISIGSKVRIFPGMRMEAHQNGSLIIEDNVSIGQNLHITCGSKLVIRTGCIMSGNVMITDMDHEYAKIDAPVFDQGMILKETDIGENCFLGYGVIVQAGTKLGKQCVVGANSVVRGEFPDYCVIVGSPARVVKMYNHETEYWEKVTND